MEEIKNYSEFLNLVDEAKYSCSSFLVNGRTCPKSKIHLDFEDIFDNDILVRYKIENKILVIQVGDEKEKKT